MGKIPAREEAMDILTEYNENESLIRHALSVEAVMRHFAGMLGEDAEKWGAVGLLHDLDYEKYPEEHCVKVVEILTDKGVDESFIRSIVSHGYGICSDVEPSHIMEKVLFATDELTGLVTAAALMRPSKSVMDLEYKSLWKKYKTPSFAAGVNRDVVERGVEMLKQHIPQADLKYVIEEVIKAMRGVAENIGL